MALPQSFDYICEEEYLAFDRESDIRHECVAGEIIATAGGKREHSVIISNMSRSLGNQLDGTPCTSVSSEMILHVVSAKAYRYPNVMVVCVNPQFKDYQTDIVTNPIILIEVLSQSTASVEHIEKFDEYTKIPTLQEYLLIEQNEPLIKQYIRQDDDQWLYRKTTGLDSTLELPSINCTLQLSKVYQTISFDSQNKT